MITTGLSLFFSAIQLIDKLNELMPHHPGLLRLAAYSLLNMPMYFMYMLPMSALICTILTFAVASRRGEIIAFKAAGGDIRNLLVPFLVTGVILSMVNMALGEYVVPAFNKDANDLVYRIREDKTRIRLQQGNIWIRGKNGLILHADMFIPDRNMLKKVLVFKIIDNRPQYIISAKEAEWNKGKWVLKDVRWYDFVNRRVVDMSRTDVGGISEPEVFSGGVSKPDEMGIIELYNYRNRLDAAGYRSSKLDVDILSRFIYPFTCFFMVLTGFIIALMRGLRSGMLSVAVGVITSLLYWFIYTFMLSLGYSGVVPPPIAAGLVPMIFLIVSIAMIKKVPR